MKFKSLADQLAECTDEEVKQLYVAGKRYWQSNREDLVSPFAEMTQVNDGDISDCWAMVREQIIDRWLNTSR